MIFPTRSSENPAKDPSGTGEVLHDVLLIEPDSKEGEIYADLIREVSNCRIDVISRVNPSFDSLATMSYHLIVVDLSMNAILKNQSIDGVTVLENIKRASPQSSVILLSNRASVREAVACIRFGAEEYFEKPFNLEEFKLAVKRSLDRKTVFGEDSGFHTQFQLLNTCQMISSTMEKDRIFSIVRGFFSQELHSKYTAIYKLRDSEPLRVDRRENDPALDEIIDVAVFATNPLEKIQQAHETFRWIDRGQLTPGLFIFRFKCGDPDDYFCVCLSPSKHESMDDFANQISLLSKQIELTGHNIREYMGMKNLVYVDDATGLYNTRYLNFILDREIRNADKNKNSFAVLFIDVDHFKIVNDENGHLVGTKLLNELGNRLRGLVRDEDTVFRYGGDEFIAVLSPCDLATAKRVAGRIRESVEVTRFLAREALNIRFTVSIGVALFPDHAKSKKQVIEMADAAMYQAKKKSRNCVYVVGEDKPPSSVVALKKSKK